MGRREAVAVFLIFCCHFLEGSFPAVVSDKEIDCFSQEKIYHKPTDKCYKLLTTGPCRRGYWFVLEKPKESARGTLNATIIKAKCAKEFCRDGEYYWRNTNSCVRSADKTKLCGDAGEELVTNVFGEAECTCSRDPPRARHEGDSSNRCYLLYTQGPCPPTQVFGYSQESEKPTCIFDPCYAQTLLKRQNKIIGKDAILAPWGNGTCFELGTRGPCPEGLTFKVHTSLMTPQCVSLTNSLFQLDKPPNCFPDEEGRCQQPIQASKNETAVNYRKELFKRFTGERKRRGAYGNSQQRVWENRFIRKGEILTVGRY